MIIARVDAQLNSDLWSFELASANTGLSADLLRHLVRNRVLRGHAPRGVQLGDCDIAQAREIAAQLGAARRPVEGVGISAPVAESKYGFNNNSIYRWHADGWIKVVSETESGRKLFNEGDIAFARTLADLIGHLPGRSVFPPKPRSGRPKKQR